MHHSRAQLGARGEACAAAYLTAAGYRILAQNIRIDGVEIDLIAMHEQRLVFVEVKARRGSTHGRAEEAVDLRKQMRLVRGACAWLQSQRQANAAIVREMRAMRFDVIACELEARPLHSASHAFEATSDTKNAQGTIFEAPDGTRWKIRHFENAFDANF